MSHALRQREIEVNSSRGLRAKEIASLTWDMATNLGGEIGTAVHLTNEASKGRGGGRVTPLDRELKVALLSLRQSLSRARPSLQRLRGISGRARACQNTRLEHLSSVWLQPSGECRIGGFDDQKR